MDSFSVIKKSNYRKYCSSLNYNIFFSGLSMATYYRYFTKDFGLFSIFYFLRKGVTFNYYYIDYIIISNMLPQWLELYILFKSSSTHIVSVPLIKTFCMSGTIKIHIRFENCNLINNLFYMNVLQPHDLVRKPPSISKCYVIRVPYGTCILKTE